MDVQLNFRKMDMFNRASIPISYPQYQIHGHTTSNMDFEILVYTTPLKVLTHKSFLFRIRFSTKRPPKHA